MVWPFSVERGERPTSLAKIIAEVNRDMDEYLPQGHSRRAGTEGQQLPDTLGRTGCALAERGVDGS